MRFSSAVFAVMTLTVTAPGATWCVSGRMSGFLGLRVWFCVVGDMEFKIIHRISTRLRTSLTTPSLLPGLSFLLR